MASDTAVKALTAAGEVAKLASAVYGDVAAGTTREIGDTITVAVRVALKPVRGCLLLADQAEDYIAAGAQEWLRRRKVADGNVQTPNKRVYAESVLGAALAGDDTSIREMFAKLVASAMDSAAASQVHPAFAETVRQLAPDEALILAAVSPYRDFPLDQTVVGTVKGGSRARQVSVSFDLPRESVTLAHPIRGSLYLEHLRQLGLVELSGPEPDRGPLKFPAKGDSASTAVSPGVARLRLTSFGVAFWNACVCEPPRGAPIAE